MKRELIPYYVSRAMLAVLFGFYVAFSNAVWLGLLLGIVTFVGFLWYAHGGWYLIEPATPLYPLRRDKRGEAIRDRAILVAVTAAILFYVIFSRIAKAFVLTVSIGSWAFVLGAVTYLAVSYWLYWKR
ncbi:MAG: hypothetical protein H6656_14725 [Ardenticatenaceae bacterium]|nr:hypothetical protein [Ardenticatenaceae bacterium]